MTEEEIQKFRAEWQEAHERFEAVLPPITESLRPGEPAPSAGITDAEATMALARDAEQKYQAYLEAVRRWPDG